MRRDTGRSISRQSGSSHHDAAMTCRPHHGRHAKADRRRLRRSADSGSHPRGAYADDERIKEETSLINSDAYKSVTASCPDDTVVVGVGGRTQKAGGKAVLIGIVPSPDL